MRSWNLREIDAPEGTRDPVVIETRDDARAVLIVLSPGQELGDHQVKERAWLVVVDETGEEREVERPAELRKEPKRNGTRPAANRRGGKIVQPPSWSRVGKRALIFAPVMFIVVSLIGGKQLSLPQRVLETLFLLAFFLPFSYVMDTVAYRAFRKRAERG